MQHLTDIRPQTFEIHLIQTAVYIGADALSRPMASCDLMDLWKKLACRNGGTCSTGGWQILLSANSQPSSCSCGKLNWSQFC
jgi:hypothetical protein